MSYCSSCGAYMPDWADECPACGAPRTDTGKKAGTRKKTSGQSSASATGAAQQKSGEYHYSYRKSEKEDDGGNDARKRWSGAGRADDKGTFTYGGSRRAEGGAFTYGGARTGDYGEPRGRRDYEREYKSDAKKNKLLAALCYFGPMFLLSWLLKPKSSFVKYHVNQGLVFFLMCVIINIFDFIPFVGLLNIFVVVCFVCGVSNALKGKRKPLPGIGEITLLN